MLHDLKQDNEVLRRRNVTGCSLPVQLFTHQLIRPTIRRLPSQRHGQILDVEHARRKVGQLGGEFQIRFIIVIVFFFFRRFQKTFRRVHVTQPTRRQFRSEIMTIRE